MSSQCECHVDSNNCFRCDYELRKIEVLNKIANLQFKALLQNNMKRYYALRIRYEKVRSL